jgi:hypothetical protein
VVGRTVASLQDATPLVLTFAWIGLVISLLQAAWVSATLAAVLSAYHVWLI